MAHRNRLPLGGPEFLLLPRHRVRLFAPHGDGERFARVFKDTWRGIPFGPRRSILAHWRKPCLLLGWQPAIDLLDGWSGRQGGRGLRGDKAVVTLQGHQLRFWRPIVAAYPDALVSDLIAHELAHVYQHSKGMELDSAIEYEEDADTLVECWGFSSTGMDEWDRAHGLTKVVMWDELSPSQKRRFFQRVERNGR